MLEGDDDAVDDEEKPTFEVWPENWQAVMLFCALAGQWRIVAGFAQVRYIALDSAAIEAEMRMRGVKRKDQPQLLVDLRVMERAARKILNRSRGG